MQQRNRVLALMLSLLCCCCCCCDCLTRTQGSVEINLNATCINDQLNICILSNLVTTNEPISWSNRSAPHLREIVLRNSMIRLMPMPVFDLAPNIESFIMHNCGLYRLNVEDFRSAHSLTKLLLQKNRISKLMDKQFALLPKLLVLELGNNIIHTVHGGAFVNLTQLKYLGLQGNGIRNLMEGVFVPLKELEYIDLSGNELDKIDAQTFVHNAKLKTLLLHGNHFSVFEPDALLQLRQLRLLDLSNSNVEVLHLQTVETLRMQECGLKVLVIGGGVGRLFGSYNELTQVSIGDKMSVIELDLHGNRLNTTELVAGMFNLERLDLSKNMISSINLENFLNYLPLVSLTHLSLASNQLQELSAENFLLMPRLIHLDISFNHLLRLNATIFEPLINLEKFYIEGNRLHAFDYELFLRNHAQLKEVGLCDNEWEFEYMRKMINFLGDRGVHLPTRFVKLADNANTLLKTVPKLELELEHAGKLKLIPNAEAQHAGMTGIHPYWTTRDVLAFVTLLVVFIIMLMQIYHILQEEGCFRNCRWLGLQRRGNEANNRPRRLNEEDSEQSSYD